MIPFERLDLNQRQTYESYLTHIGDHGCEYTFVNKFLWGRQKAAFLGDWLVLFSQFDRRSVYPFPIGTGDLRPVLDAIIHDARARGIPCYLTGMTKADCEAVESLYPNKFRFHMDRDSFDYVYAIDDLADLKGRKFQKKRNHANRFDAEHPDFRILPLDENTLGGAFDLLQQWYKNRAEIDPLNDFHLEKVAAERAFALYPKLGMDGIVLMDGEEILAFTMGSFLTPDTMDIHFEKAREDVSGAYNAINREFARYLRQKYPALRWLNREEDMGLEGLRKAKLSYNPDHLVEKYWARLWEEEDEN